MGFRVTHNTEHLPSRLPSPIAFYISQNPSFDLPENSSMESVQDSSRSIIPAMISTSSNSIWMDEDLIPEILKRLPVKSLLRLRCVCKYWKSLISSYSFIKLHYSYTCCSTPAYLKPYLRRRQTYHRVPYCDYFLHCPQENYIVRIHFPFRFRNIGSMCLYHFDFVDLIKGLICISYSLNRYTRYFILWNPAIQKYLPLPLQPNPSSEILGSFERSYRSDIGFGYDSCKDDFKVVRIWLPSCNQGWESPLVPVCEVYSYRRGVWRVLIPENIKFFPFRSIQSCFVNGTVHWVVADQHDVTKHFVLMFDCESEVFSSMKLPQDIDQDINYEGNPMVYLLEYGGMLSLVTYSDGCVKLRVMEEYGVATSWKLLSKISNDTQLNWIIDVSQSYQKIAPYGPNDCISIRLNADLYHTLCNNVYEESLLLMNDTSSLSYAKAETVHIDIPYCD